MADKTSFVQALMHMIKGNLGAGILAMPASFAHTGLVGGTLGLPVLCLISAYCVHLLLRSSQYIASRSKGQNNCDYASLAKYSFDCGPECLQGFSGFMSRFVDGILLVTQIGVCCVYIVFVVDNITTILDSYDIVIAKSFVFMAVFPFVLALSYIRTLKRLAIASMLANLLQAVGLSLILEYLLRDFRQIEFNKRENLMPIKDMALGFGSAMFAFEGISVVLPIYSRLKNPMQMANSFGVVNLSFISILILYFVVGLFGYLKFGHHVKDSITLNLPAEPLYDAVRAMFTTSLALTYPLQLYVPNEIIWNYIKNNLLLTPVVETTTSSGNGNSLAIDMIVPKIKLGLEKVDEEKGKPEKSGIALQPVKLFDGRSSPLPATINQQPIQEPGELLRHEYCCRTLIVVLTFTLAYSVPKLNLLMDLVGSMSGTTLSLTLPATIHLATFWNETKGFKKVVMIFIDGLIIIFSLIAGGFGSVVSLTTILKSFNLD